MTQTWNIHSWISQCGMLNTRQRKWSWVDSVCAVLCALSSLRRIMPPSFSLQLWRVATTVKTLREYCTTWGLRSWCVWHHMHHHTALMDFIWQPLFLQVEVIKKAYMQGEIEVEEPQEGEEGEEEHSASPRNVGHNIYILAHQVSHQLSVKSACRHIVHSQWTFSGLTFTVCLSQFLWLLGTRDYLPFYTHLLFFSPRLCTAQ